MSNSFDLRIKEHLQHANSTPKSVKSLGESIVKKRFLWKTTSRPGSNTKSAKGNFSPNFKPLKTKIPDLANVSPGNCHNGQPFGGKGANPLIAPEHSEENLFEAIQQYAGLTENGKMPVGHSGLSRKRNEAVARKAKIIATINEGTFGDFSSILENENGSFTQKEILQLQMSKSLLQNLLQGMSRGAALRYIKKNYGPFDRLYLEYLMSKLQKKKKKK